MDPYSRRSTWQILQNAREGRITIITTHFMDEVRIRHVKSIYLYLTQHLIDARVMAGRHSW